MLLSKRLLLIFWGVEVLNTSCRRMPCVVLQWKKHKDELLFFLQFNTWPIETEKGFWSGTALLKTRKRIWLCYVEWDVINPIALSLTWMSFSLKIRNYGKSVLSWRKCDGKNCKSPLGQDLRRSQLTVVCTTHIFERDGSESRWSITTYFHPWSPLDSMMGMWYESIILKYQIGGTFCNAMQIQMKWPFAKRRFGIGGTICVDRYDIYRGPNPPHDTVVNSFFAKENLEFQR